MNLDIRTKFLLLLSSFCFDGVFAGGRTEGFEQYGRGLSHYRGRTRSSHFFDVQRYGARADGLTDDSKAFRAAWKEACEAKGEVDLVIPKGTYLVGPVKFAGPCQNVSKITVHVKGYLKATTNLSKYGDGSGWVEFRWVEGLTLTGGGTFDGQGAKAWPYNRCSTDLNCKLLPTNVKFVATNRTVVRSITSVNSKFFHIALVECMNFKGSKIKISAPADSPNTDGIHIQRSSSVLFSQSLIGTGDDCISIGQGNTQVTVTSISCGPGHGISVGSLGRYRDEGDVSGLVVRDCTMRATTNGIRIKTWANSPGRSAATNMTFENINMNNVTNPIIIDQAYCPFTSCTPKSDSEIVAFPLLKTLTESNYRACTIPYRFPSDNPRKATPTEIAWIDLFRKSIPSFKKRAESDANVADAPTKAEKFAQRYAEILDDLKKDPESHGGPPDCILLCRLREQVLRELGFRDIFKKVKDKENAKTISLFQDVVRLNDNIEDEGQRLENLVRGIFAGYIFDLGSAQLAEVFSRDGMPFWLVVKTLFLDLGSSMTWTLLKQSGARNLGKRQAVIFVDNSGADVILGIMPFARELLRRGTQVVLAANDLPSINGVTYPELVEIVSKLKDENGKLLGVDTSNLLIASSGNDLLVIDLTRVSQELAYLASDADLVILEGMGRGIETNLYAQFKCDSLKIGMVKHPEVAQFLGGRLYDCVFKYNEVLG
ncbi:hypothetical protein PTKIN_Ptkin02bG0143700 [Pterospermum kingtungense]